MTEPIKVYCGHDMTVDVLPVGEGWIFRHWMMTGNKWEVLEDETIIENIPQST